MTNIQLFSSTAPALRSHRDEIGQEVGGADGYTPLSQRHTLARENQLSHALTGDDPLSAFEKDAGNLKRQLFQTSAVVKPVKQFELPPTVQKLLDKRRLEAQLKLLSENQRTPNRKAEGAGAVESAVAKIVIDAAVDSSPQVAKPAATMRAPAQHDAGPIFEQRSNSASKIPQVKNFEKLRANSQMQKRRSSSKSKLRNPTKIC